MLLLEANSKYVFNISLGLVALNIKKTTTIINNIDGIDNVQGIAILFAEKYDDLYNSVSYDVDDMSTLKETVENKILCSCGKWSPYFCWKHCVCFKSYWTR